MASPLTIHALPEQLRRPVLIMAFAGWNDASEAATTAARTLARAWSAERFATIDPEEFYHFGLSRPHIPGPSGRLSGLPPSSRRRPSRNSTGT